MYDEAQFSVGVLLYMRIQERARVETKYSPTKSHARIDLYDSHTVPGIAYFMNAAQSRHGTS